MNNDYFPSFILDDEGEKKNKEPNQITTDKFSLDLFPSCYYVEPSLWEKFKKAFS